MMTVLSPVTADIISCVEFNDTGDLLATGDKGGRVVIFQRDESVSLPKSEQIGNNWKYSWLIAILMHVDKLSSCWWRGR